LKNIEKEITENLLKSEKKEEINQFKFLTNFIVFFDEIVSRLIYLKHFQALENFKKNIDDLNSFALYQNFYF
jgi:hypothetical protein